MNPVLKSILLLFGGFVIVFLSFSLLIRIIPFLGKFFLFVGLGMILFGFFSFLFNVFKR